MWYNEKSPHSVVHTNDKTRKHTWASSSTLFFFAKSKKKAAVRVYTKQRRRGKNIKQEKKNALHQCILCIKIYIISDSDEKSRRRHLRGFLFFCLCLRLGSLVASSVSFSAYREEWKKRRIRAHQTHYHHQSWGKRALGANRLRSLLTDWKELHAYTQAGPTTTCDECRLEHKTFFFLLYMQLCFWLDFFPWLRSEEQQQASQANPIMWNRSISLCLQECFWGSFCGFITKMQRAIEWSRNW